MGVFDLERLAQFVTSRMGPLLVEHQRCSRTRSPLSKCSHCIDICPENALSFGAEGIEIADNCLECGLCAGVCPTGALGIQEPTQLALLEKIRSLNTQGVTIAIGCRRQPELNPKGLSVPCLGCLSREFLLVLEQASHPVYFVLAEEKCAECPVTGGREHCLNRLTEVGQIIATLGLKGGAIRLVPEAPPIKIPKKKEDTDPSRRAFFRSIFSGAKQVPKAMVQSILDDEPAEDAGSIKAVSGVEVDRQRLLRKGLEPLKESMGELDLLQRPVLQSTCHFCRACTILCPLGALKCSDDYRLTLDTGKCTGCGLCTDICLHQSLALGPGKIAQLYQAEPELLAQGVKGRCQSCGQEMVTSEENEFCFICAKRAAMMAN